MAVNVKYNTLEKTAVTARNAEGCGFANAKCQPVTSTGRLVCHLSQEIRSHIRLEVKKKTISNVSVSCFLACLTFAQT